MNFGAITQIFDVVTRRSRCFLKSFVKSLVKFCLYEAPAAMFDKPLNPPSAKEEALIKEFRDALASLRQEISGNQHITEAWKQNIIKFVQAGLERDPRQFLRWDECLPLRAGPGVLPQYLALKKSPHWRSKWSSALKDSPVGYPYPFFMKPTIGCNIVLHASHLDVFQRYADFGLESAKLIVEFGGGFGGLCRLIHSLGFKGKYIIFDLPQQNILQRYYLKSNELPVRDLADTATDGIWLISDTTSLRESYEKMSLGDEKGIFIANWSMSESPIALRDQVTKDVISKCRAILITFQERFADIDNTSYFQKWAALLKDRFDIQITQMPMRKPADFYLLGKKR